MQDQAREPTTSERKATTLSRREVLVGVGALGVGAVGAGILGSCQSPSAPVAPAASAAPAPPASQTAAARAPQSLDMKMIGFNDLQSRSSYQPTILKYPNGRYILLVGHHTLDVHPATNPRPRARRPARRARPPPPTRAGGSGTPAFPPPPPRAKTKRPPPAPPPPTPGSTPPAPPRTQIPPARGPRRGATRGKRPRR